MVFIAEIYNPREYHNYIKVGGFDYLYDKVGLYDGLRRLVEQKHEATVEDITRVWQHESGDISEHMLRFLENHDEQRVNTPAFAKGNPLHSACHGRYSHASHRPVMIYFGQELGEKADGKEGFNQADDRTTMFDFWGVPSHQAWMNGGKFDGAGLTEEQKNLQAFYKGLLKFVNGSEAVQKGAFFDLQYIQNHEYDRRKVYSYLRYSENQKLVVVCNFDHYQEKNISLHIPDGAWSVMELDPQGNYTLKGVYEAKGSQKINAKENISIKVAPNSAVIYEISSKK
jgi:glycosidase